jgi:hypothetical protein
MTAAEIAPATVVPAISAISVTIVVVVLPSQKLTEKLSADIK